MISGNDFLKSQVLCRWRKVENNRDVAECSDTIEVQQPWMTGHWLLNTSKRLVLPERNVHQMGQGSHCSHEIKFKDFSRTPDINFQALNVDTSSSHIMWYIANCKTAYNQVKILPTY